MTDGNYSAAAGSTNPILPKGGTGESRPKKTMTLNLTEEEMTVLEVLSAQKDMSKTAVMRQALRLYQLVDVRISRGERLFVEDQQKKSELILLCCSNPTPVTMESEVVPCSCGRPEPGDVICRYCRSPVSERTRGCHVCGGRGVGFDGRPCPECNR